MKLNLQLLLFLLIITKVSSQSKENRFTSTTILLEESFGFGPNTTTEGISSAYCYNSQQLPQTCSSPQLALEESEYLVTKAINPNKSAWFSFRDHTTNGINPDGRFLAVNIGSAAGLYSVLYSKKIYDVILDQPIFVEAYVGNLLRADFIGGTDPGLIFEIRTDTGVLISQSPMLSMVDLILRSNSWQFKTLNLNPGSVVNPYLVFNILSSSIINFGNDVVLDDIKVYQTTSLKTQDAVFEKIAIYPNPAKNNLNIDNVAIQKVTFYNTLGSIVKIIILEENMNNNIDISDLSKGIYLLKLENQQKSMVEKIIIE